MKGNEPLVWGSLLGGIFLVGGKWGNFWLVGGLSPSPPSRENPELCSICQEPYIIWLSFMVQMCKIIISPGVFFNFKILIFWVFKWLKGQKMAQNDKIFRLSHSISQEPYIIWLWFLLHMCFALYLRNCRSHRSYH